MGEELRKDVYEADMKRIDEQQRRQDRRIEIIENDVRDLQKLTAAVEKLADNMARMAKDMENISNRLDAIEEKPAKAWDKAVWIVVTALLSAAVGFFLKGVI